MLLDFVLADRHQFTLDLAPTPFSEATHPAEGARSRLMGVLDGVNRRYGRGTILLASGGLEGASRTWTMRQERMTPQYTTNWDDLATARA